MKFTCEDKKYDTDEMIVLDGDLGPTLGIYITPDHKCVFACYMGESGVIVLPVDGDALRRMAENLKHPQLIRAVAVFDSEGENDATTATENDAYRGNDSANERRGAFGDGGGNTGVVERPRNAGG